MSTPTTLIPTRPVKRAAHRAVDLAKGLIRLLLMISESGGGKTSTIRWIVQKLSWPHPISHYMDLVRDAEGGDEYCSFSGIPHGRLYLEDVVGFAMKIGLVTTETRDQAEEFLERRFTSTREWIKGSAVCYWLEWLAARLGQPRPDALALAPLRGIPEEIKWRFPIHITGSIMETPRSLIMKIVAALELGEAPEARNWYRYSFVTGWLRKIPVVFFLDEADTLSIECLRTFQQLCEDTATPFCLAGTQQLVGRLLRDPRLRPIATRIEVRVDLGRVAAGDLQEAFPQYASDIILAVWTASGKNWRIAAHIIQGLEELRRERPGVRIGKRAVAAVAQQVLAARAIRLEADDLEEAEALAGLGVAPITQARPVPMERPARRAAQAVG